LTRAHATSDRALIASIALGLSLRLLWAATVPVAPVSDSFAYHSFASTLAEHGVFGWSARHPDAYWAPGAAVAYALAYRIFGPSGFAVVALNLAIAVAKTLLLWRVTHRWFGRGPAIAACFAVSCWPTQIMFTTVLSSEHLFDAVLLAAVAVFEKGWNARAPIAWLVIGALLAAASFVRPTALPLGVGLAVVGFARRGGVARSAVHAAIACAVMAALLSPWMARNQGLFGRFVPISANAGANLWMGNNPDSQGVYMALPAEVRGMDTAERDAYLGELAKEWMRENPGRALALALRKAGLTHARETIGVAWNARGLEAASRGTVLALKVIATGFWWLALAAGLAGVAIRVRARGFVAFFAEPPIALWGYFALVHAVTVAQDRYHLASVPYIAALAGLAASELRMLLSSERSAAAQRLAE
jgi:4-amino-4-deoxy-L-arabinose transferase-like glycosyltransferase